MNEKHALEVQIMEFGQIPKQIFRKPHVRRILQSVKRPLEDHLQMQEQINEIIHKTKCNITNIKENASFHSHREGVSCVLISEDGKRVISAGKDALLKVYCLEEKRQSRSVSIGTMCLSSCVQMDDNTIIVGSWDNHM